MTKQTQEDQNQKADTPPRVIADFGGRRKVLDRRLKPSDGDNNNRRSGTERRSGFDRRSALNQLDENEPDHRKPGT